MVERGIFAHVDAAMMVHPGTKAMVARGSIASNTVTLEFFGKSAHAAAAPDAGINALDACIQTFNSINALRQHLPQDVRIHGIITHGGTAVNVVPEYAAARFSVRACPLAGPDRTRPRPAMSRNPSKAARTVMIVAAMTYSEASRASASSRSRP